MMCYVSHVFQVACNQWKQLLKEERASSSDTIDAGKGTKWRIGAQMKDELYCLAGSPMESALVGQQVCCLSVE